MPLPEGSHAVRVCPGAALGDGGEITPDCFAPHTGTDTRPADRYLSVHWAEYLGRGPLFDCLARLRAYLQNSPIPREFTLKVSGKLAVLPCDLTARNAILEVQTQVDFQHAPRVERLDGGVRAATSIEIAPDGTVRYGVAPEQKESRPDLLLDPHSGLFTLPEAAAHQLAVQQFLASQVVHIEQAKLVRP